jgi:hypothetical protein
MPSLAEQHAVFEEDADSGIRRVVSHGGGAVRPSWPELVVLVRAQVRSLVGATRDLCRDSKVAASSRRSRTRSRRAS